MYEEFKKFIMRGNVVDLAVGVIIGAAFGGIVTSLVADILMPPIAYATGGIDFSQKSIDLPGSMIDPETKNKPVAEQKLIPVRLKWGAFLQKVIDFIIIAICLFLVIKAVNRMQKKKEEAPSEPSASEKLLTEIRDLLKNQTK
jgi:large conductance mechanosensitive channel